MSIGRARTLYNSLENKEEFLQLNSNILVAYILGEETPEMQEEISEYLSENRDMESISNEIENTAQDAEGYIPSLISNSGRFYLYNNTWITNSDDNYGTGYFQFAENAGRNEIPTIEWEHKGDLIPKGRKIKSFKIAGEINSLDVTDLEIYIVLKRPNPLTKWKTGLNNDSDQDIKVLYHDNYYNPSEGEIITSPVNYTSLKEIEINHLVDETSYLCIYIKPVGSLSRTRYFKSTYTWEIE